LPKPQAVKLGSKARAKPNYNVSTDDIQRQGGQAQWVDPGSDVW
jgi:hypothetical protein